MRQKVSGSQREASPASSLNEAGARRYCGLSLSGGKADKACLAVLDWYPSHKKVFLSALHEKIASQEDVSGDQKIYDFLQRYTGRLILLGVDTPWQLPLCLSCRLPCPGFERCREPHIRWLWEHNKKRYKGKKPKKIFTPYTQRCVEMHLLTELEERFDLGHALGANTAPRLARAAFLVRRLGLPTVEVAPAVSLWRIGRSLGIAKSHLRFHSHSIDGEESRHIILKELADHNVVFLYREDVRSMTANNHAFEAFITAITAFLYDRGVCEEPPSDFPAQESWIAFPKVHISWQSIY
ncbi:MAG: DUF429 domain-containing protein [Bdellovibrionaceae bacterium]|nr:DUF429 domain-containing protein [Pseudobdellovibrionaceae bacterium]